MSQIVARIYEALEELYPKRRQQMLFMQARQPMLNDQVPNDLIDAGRGKEVFVALRKWLDQNPR